jgi:hypothetical protein
VTWPLYKPVNDSVHGRCLFWTIFAAVYKPGVVHKRYLWICRSLSTGCGFLRCCRLASMVWPGVLHAGCRHVLFAWQLADRLFFKSLALTGFCQNSQNRFTVKRIYTRIVVVVNTWHFLWTRAFLSTESGVYTFYKAVNDPVSGASQSWTRFWRVANNGFVHKSCLWISRRLSTGTGDQIRET